MKIKQNTIRLVAASLATLTMSLPVSANADSDWNHTLALYMWGMNVKGTSSIGPIDSDVDLNFRDDLLDNVTGAFSAHYEAKNGRLTLFGDYMYSDLDPKTELSNGTEIDIDFKNKMWEAGVAWDLAGSANSTIWQVLGGIRSNKQEFRVQVGSPVLVSVNEKWYDGFIGGRVIAPFANNWKFIGRLDVGTGDSDSVWNALTAVDWRFQPWGSLLLGYRWLDYDYDNGKRGRDRYAYDARQDGVVAAFGLYW
jgi:hypothetical protein